MTAIDGFPAQSGVVDPVELRKVLAGLIIRTAAGTPRAGVFPRTTTAIVTALASMNVAVAAFEACAVRGGGPVFQANDGTVNVAIAAAPGANSRIDVVWYRQKENGYGGFADGSNGAEIGVTTGTPAASPTKPAIPTGAVELATVLVPTGVATTNAVGVVITQTYAWTALTGSKIWVRNDTELQALTGFAADTRALRLDNMTEYRFDGAAWKAWESDWTSRTPTLGGITIGTTGQVNSQEWRYFGGRVHVKGRAKMGASGSSVSGTITVDLPVNRAALNHSWQGCKGRATFYDDNLAVNYDAFVAANAASVTSVALLSPGTNGLRVGSGASTPFTWASPDMVSYDFEYDPA